MGVCVECGAESSLVCSRCRAAAYCGAACQRAAWAQHKLPCESAALAKLQGTLEGLGFASKALSRCALGAIVRGHLLFSGGAAELDAPARLRGGGALTVRDQGSGDCRHELRPTLRSLLIQRDGLGYNYCERESYSILCGEPGCDGYAAVLGMCTGGFNAIMGREMQHCRRCPGIGKCIGDSRSKHCKSCGRHYSGTYGNKCRTCHPNANVYDMMDWNAPGGRKLIHPPWTMTTLLTRRTRTTKRSRSRGASG